MGGGATTHTVVYSQGEAVPSHEPSVAPSRHHHFPRASMDRNVLSLPKNQRIGSSLGEATAGAPPALAPVSTRDAPPLPRLPPAPTVSEGAVVHGAMAATAPPAGVAGGGPAPCATAKFHAHTVPPTARTSTRANDATGSGVLRDAGGDTARSGTPADDAVIVPLPAASHVMRPPSGGRAPTPTVSNCPGPRQYAWLGPAARDTLVVV